MQKTEETRVIKIFESFRLGFCKCGCGQELTGGLWTRHGVLKRYRYHHNLGKLENSPCWKGGRIEHNGYIYLNIPNHPNANKKGYVAEHVYNFTEFHKCCMLKWGHVHHIDKNPTNNKSSNLRGMRNGQHIKIHHIKNMSDRFCLICNSNTTTINLYGYKCWRKYKNGWQCFKCYQKQRYHNKK